MATDAGTAADDQARGRAPPLVAGTAAPLAVAAGALRLGEFYEDEPFDFADLDVMERIVVPGLERLISESIPGTPDWRAWVGILGIVRGHVLIIRRMDRIEDRLDELARHVSRMTEVGVERILLGEQRDGE